MRSSRCVFAVVIIVYVFVFAGQSLSMTAESIERINDVLKRGGCPLTVEQIAKLKELPDERGSFRLMMEVLDDRQSKVLRDSFRSHWQ